MSKPKYKVSHIEENMLKYGIELTSTVIINGIITKYFITSNGTLFYYDKNFKRHDIEGHPDKSGYIMVTLRVGSKFVHISKHRLVASTFIANPKQKNEINHKDGNKSNNTVFNLEWVTRSENMKHSYRIGLHKRGEYNTNSKYKEKMIRKVCELLEENKLTMVEISKKTLIPIDIIVNIRKGRKWTHISSEYDISNYNVKSFNTGSIKKYSDEKIHDVCKMLEKNIPASEIFKNTGVSTYVIHDVKRRKTRCDISKNYTF